MFRGVGGRRPQRPEKLILHNMRLVAHVIKKYGMPQPEQEELISIGTVGLVKAVDSSTAPKVQVRHLRQQVHQQ
ncbi:MAG: hypothetical protein ACLUOF_00180 [Ruminococcus sp.]